MIKETSGYDSFDLLNTEAAIASGGQTAVREPSRFSNALNSINQFLNTATHTIVTVDGVINKDKQSSVQQPLYPGQHITRGPQSVSFMKYLAIAGVAVGGGIIVMKGFKK
jgi:hypothetical protein